jgi:hypothetical protein
MGKISAVTDALRLSYATSTHASARPILTGGSMPFSSKRFRLEFSCRPHARALRFAKLGWNAPHLSRSGGGNYPHRNRPSFWITMRMSTAPRSGSMLFWHRLRKQQVTSTMRYEARWGALHAVDERQVLFGCGSSEILRMAATRLVADSPTRKYLTQALPTSPALGKFARSIGGNVIDVRLDEKKLNTIWTRC